VKEPDELAAELPNWPRESLEADFVAIRAYLSGKLANQVGKAFGDAALLWETLRHNEDFLRLLDRSGPQMPEILKAKGVKTKEELFAVTDNLGAFSAPFGFIVCTEGFPVRPFTALPQEQQVELAECFATGERAVELADIRRLDVDGYIEWLRDQAKGLALKPIGAAKDAKKSWRLCPKLTEGERVWNITFTVRGHHGIDAVEDDIRVCLKDIAERDPSLFAIKYESLSFQQARDPRRLLRDLALVRLTYLLGFDNAKKWTSDNRPSKTLRPIIDSDWYLYFRERGVPKAGPLFRGRKEYWCRAIDRGVVIARTPFNFT
jgi:hypothetical protein